jgi:hypothetical protein
MMQKVGRFFQLIFVGIFIFISLNPKHNQIVNALTLSSSNYQGGEESIACDATDILLLIDQSGSMYGLESTNNDPNRIRYHAAMQVIDILANRYLLEKQDGSKMVTMREMNIAIIRFASTAKTSLAWTRIAPSSYENWETQRQDLENKVVLDTKQENVLAREIGYETNFLNAFLLAEQLFNEKEEPADGCPQRLILVLTDGKPNVGYDLSGSALDDHFTKVTEIVDRSLSHEGTDIYVTGMITNNSYWKDTVKYWESITKDSKELSIKKAELVNSKADIGWRMSKIVEFNISDIAIEVRPGQIVVPPYVDKLTLAFYKSVNSDMISLADSIGELSPQRDDTKVIVRGQGDAIQTIEVIRPQPGIYYLSTTAKSEDYRITQSHIFVKANLVAPIGSFTQLTTSEIKFDLKDSDGQPLPDYGDSRYDLKINADLTYNGETKPISMAMLDQDTIIGSFTPMQSGTYLLSLSATTLNNLNEVIEVLQAEYSKFGLLVDPVEIKPGDTSDLREGCTPTKNSPFTVPLTLVNTASNKDVIINLPIEWRVVSKDTNTSLQITGPDESGTFTLQVTPTQAGNVQISVEASAADPIDAKMITFDTLDLRIPVNESTHYTVQLLEIGPLMNKTALAFDNMFNRLIGNGERNDIIIGRRFFFFPQKVAVKAEILDTNTQSSGPTDLMPVMTFVNEDTKEKHVSGSWKSDGQGNIVTEFSPLPFGDYQLTLDAKETTCDTVLTIQSYNETWRISPDIWERILTIIGIVLGLTAFILLILLVLCKFVNQAYGVIGIVNEKNEAVYRTSLTGRSCWKIKTGSPYKYGQVEMIKISGLFMAKNSFRYQIKVITDAKKNKVEKKAGVMSLGSGWHPIPIGLGYKIDWKKSSNEFIIK